MDCKVVHSLSVYVCREKLIFCVVFLNDVYDHSPLLCILF
jgi:hypothetical protein